MTEKLLVDFLCDQLSPLATIYERRGENALARGNDEEAARCFRISERADDLMLELQEWEIKE